MVNQIDLSMKYCPILFLLFIGYITAIAQSVTPFEQRLSSETKSDVFNPVSHIPFENIGPTVQSGRVSDIEVNPEDPTKFYVAYASGGLWYTDNNGNSFEPLFDNEAVITIGDIAIDWSSETIWIGTGEVNSSRSSYAGLGMYKSEDGGKTWMRKGLEETHHIGKVLLHPDDPNVITVAALGHLYSPNDERGIYHSTDGGHTWNQALFVNENTGAVDLIRDPNDANTIYAATWHRERRSWNFVESGAGSGLYKSTDNGASWAQLAAAGFPKGAGVGRIGLTIGSTGEATKIYALLDNYDRRPQEEKDKKSEDLTKDDFREMTMEAFAKLDDKKLEKYLRSNRFPRKYKADNVKKMVKKQKVKPSDLATFTEDANSLLFDTPVVGAELYSSIDGGETWQKTHDDYLDYVYNSYGYYFGVVRVNPSNLDEVFVLGVPIIRSEDGGKTFKYIGGDNVHSDHQALWVNPNRDGHIINGNDGGINISYDDGEHWVKCNSPSVGQFYHIAVDMAKPYNVYGGLQDNGVWKGPHNYKEGTRWHSSGQYPYKSIMGGDGMQTAIDTRDNKTVYTGFQFGNYFRINTATGKRSRITPSHELGDAPYRWNWQAPIQLSEHNQDIVYFGGNKLFRSMNKGDDFEVISEDLTNGGKKGDVAYGTLTTIHESPQKFGLIYTGSDDGSIHVTQDGGYTWTNLNEGLPENLWVARVQASKHEKSRVYLALNGYRWDNFESHIYVSESYGNDWQRLGKGLPYEPVNVVKEDPENEDILYVGTDRGAYISFDMGATFSIFQGDMPAVPVHDIVIHPRDHHALIGTHGRSIYKADIKALRSFNDHKDEEIVLYELAKQRHNANLGRIFASYRDPIESKLQMTVYTKSKGNAQLQVMNEDKKILQSISLDLPAGYSNQEYDFSVSEKQSKHIKLKEDKKLEKADNDKYYLPPGTYTLQLHKNGKVSEQNLVIE